MSIFGKKNKSELGENSRNNPSEGTNGGCEPEQQKPDSTEAIINKIEKETLGVIELFKENFLKENKKEEALGPDILGEKIRTEIETIRGTKEISLEEDSNTLEKDKDSREEHSKLRETENSLKIILSIFRHDIINKLAALVSYICLSTKVNSDEKKSLIIEAERDIQKIEMLIKEANKMGEAVISGEAILHNVAEVAEDIKDTYSDSKIKINNSSRAKCLIKMNGSLYSIFDNIIANAVRHGKATQIDINISDEDYEYVIFEIENNGSQFEEGTEEKIFEKGFKNKETGNTGLGLALVRENINSSGGEVKAENTEKGVKFIVKFPLLKENDFF